MQTSSPGSSVDILLGLPLTRSGSKASTAIPSALAWISSAYRGSNGVPETTGETVRIRLAKLGGTLTGT